uniref:Ig-like domain-containing protein n=1 Tax=Gopherus agassizii TaxID=38772 RepID=A0A452GMQ7_9SAUR
TGHSGCAKVCLTPCLLPLQRSAPPNPTSPWAPARGVTLGGAATVRCQGQCWGLEFALYKAGARNAAARSRDSAGVKFPILKVSRAEGGSYTGYYPSSLDPDTWSEVCLTPCLLPLQRSAPPNPTSPWAPARGVTLGGAATVRCQGQCWGLEFALYKAGARNAAARSRDSAGVKFPILKVSRAEGGSYTGYYPSSLDPDTWSEPSDTVQLVVAGEGPSSASSLPAPPPPPASPTRRLHASGTLRARLFPGEPPISRPLSVLGCPAGHTQLASCGGWAIHGPYNMSREDGGNYSCSYHSRSEPFAVSYPSDPMELVVTGEGRGPAQPNISLSPTGVTAPGADVTIRCQGQRWDLRFFLHKAGDLNPQQHMDTAGAGAEFRIPSVSRQQEGNYSCSYRPRSEPFVCSQPSEIVQLVVVGEEPGSTSPFPAPHPAGLYAPMGRSEPGSALGPGPSRGDAWPGSRDRVTGGFPAREEQQPLEIWVTFLLPRSSPPGVPGFHQRQHCPPGAERHGPAHPGADPG